MAERVPYDAVVLAGGRAERMDGTDKVTVRIGETTLLERVLEAASGAATMVVVGSERSVDRDVIWSLEHPVGSGPAAAAAAGLRHVSADIVVLLAADLPFITRLDVETLIDALGVGDAVLFVDPDGYPQPLVGAYRVAALERALRAATDGSMQAVLGGLSPALLEHPIASFDIDTWSDLRAARARIQRF